MPAYPNCITGTTYEWVWETQNIHTGLRGSDHIGPIRRVGDERDDLQYRPRPGNILLLLAIVVVPY
jgi:hypothetical protein